MQQSITRTATILADNFQKSARFSEKKNWLRPCVQLCDGEQELAGANVFTSVMVVLSAKIEEVKFPEQVNAIMSSDPMGYMLVNERMLENFIFRRIDCPRRPPNR
ncbi:hypothetical protein niasHT_011551 [Heterodera trifolii]|uniref:Uncharacterized protein n=1 Tax=Heterodera trifolii TaxID=157864 RepID=A0ABD2LGG9_9BILA